MKNVFELSPGIYQGGSANSFTSQLKTNGDEILYIGDHIYGDILRLKKDCNWRTGLVVEELEEEVLALNKARSLTNKINDLMLKKDPYEREIIKITDLGEKTSESKHRYNEIQGIINEVDKELSKCIVEHQKFFNPLWGEVMRIGNEESYFASQVERYACIYMSRLGDLLEYSPRFYFRGFRKTLPHEI